MRIAFVVNDIATEEAGYTTTRLGVSAINRGYEVWNIGVGDLAYDPDESGLAYLERLLEGLDQLAGHLPSLVQSRRRQHRRTVG